MDLIVFADAHLYSKKLGYDTQSYKKFNGSSQKLLKDSGAVIAAAFEQICKSDCRNIIFAGDATCDGDFDSHREFTAMLSALQKCGKRVFAITSTHDYQDNGITYKYTGDIKEEIPSAKREDLAELYYPFGPADAVNVYADGMSYIAELDEKYVLFALNSDKNGKGRSGYSDEMQEWIKENATKAKLEGKEIIAFTHHPLVSPSPFYSLIGKNDMMGEHETIREMLADLGIELVFTGHSHINDISYIFSQNGNVLYDVSQSALAGYPGYMRRVTITDNSYIIKSEAITEPVRADFGGETLNEHLENQFFGMIRRLLEYAATDIPKFADYASGMSVPKKFSYKFGWLIKPIAKLLRRIKIKTVFKLVKKETGLDKSDIKKIGNRTVIDFILDLATHLYGGDAPYSPDAPEYKITIALCNVIDSVLNTIHLPFSKLLKGYNSPRDLIEPLLYNSGICDTNATLPKHPTVEKIEKMCNKKHCDVLESRKGPAIVAVLVLLIILLIPLLPIIAILLGVGYAVNYIKYHDKIRGNLNG